MLSVRFLIREESSWRLVDVRIGELAAIGHNGGALRLSTDSGEMDICCGESSVLY